MNEISRLVGERIRVLRVNKGLSQEELALKAGISPSHVGKIERGEKNCTLVSIEKVLSALEITLEDFFRYIQPSNGENENTLLPLIVSKLNRLNIKEQKEVLKLLDVLFNLMKKSDR